MIRNSIQKKLILIIVVTTTLVLSGYVIVDFIISQSRIRSNLHDLTNSISEQTSISLQVPLWNVDDNSIKEIIDSLMLEKQIFAISVKGGYTGMTGRIRDDKWNPVKLGKEVQGNYFTKTRDIFLYKQNLGSVTVYVTPAFAEKELKNKTIGMVLSIVVLNVILSVLLFFSIRKTIFFPIQDIAKNISVMASGNLDESIVLDRNDEIGMLSSQVDNMRLAIKGLTDDLIYKILELESTTEKLEESESVYRGIIENIQVVYYRSDATGNLTMASPSILTLLGYDTLEECLGRPIAETFYYLPEDRAKFLTAIMETGHVSNYEIILKKKNGQPMIAEINSHVYFDSHIRAHSYGRGTDNKRNKIQVCV